MLYDMLSSRSSLRRFQVPAQISQCFVQVTLNRSFPASHDLCGFPGAELFIEAENQRFPLAIWEGLLLRDDIGVSDNFFELGGHSLLVVQMTRAIDHTGRPVRLPGCAVEQTRNLRKAMKRFEAAGLDYTVSDLAHEVGVDKKRAEFLLAQGRTVSLDQPVDDGPRPRSLEHFLQDESAHHPDDEAIHAQEIARMLEAFDQVLTDRHRYVLTRRYGLEDNQFRTLSQVGKGMSLSRERVRQIEREALAKLRTKMQSPRINRTGGRAAR